MFCSALYYVYAVYAVEVADKIMLIRFVLVFLASFALVGWMASRVSWSKPSFCKNSVIIIWRLDLLLDAGVLFMPEITIVSFEAWRISAQCFSLWLLAVTFFECLFFPL